MKKNINIVLLVLFTLFLSSCFTSKDDITKAKQDLGIIEKEEIVEENNTNTNSLLEDREQKKENNSDIEKIVDEGDLIDNTKEEEHHPSPLLQEREQEETVEQKEEAIKVKSLTSNQFLELDDLSGSNLLKREVEITGKTLSNVDKIIVKFSNENSSFPDDTYELKQFKSGDETFLYRAFAKYETLDFGKNIFIFEAYSGDEVTKLELTLNVVLEKEETEEPHTNPESPHPNPLLQERGQEEDIKDKEEKITNDIKETDFELSLSNLPTKESFGTPVSLGNGSFSYSDLKAIEIKKQYFEDLSCENITDNLVDIINGWFFWNTCVEDSKQISYYVIRTEGDNYFYEKHYYSFSKSVYTILELETGTGIDSKNIGDKNKEFKEKNEDYSTVYIADDLFDEINNK